MRKDSWRQSGITLVELIMVAAILGLLLSFLPKLIMQIGTQIRNSTGTIDLDRDLRTSMDVIQKKMIFARSSLVSLSTPAGEPLYSRLDFMTTTGKSISVFQRRGSLIYVENGKESLLSKNLVRLFFAYPNFSDKNTLQVGVIVGKQITANQPLVIRRREALITFSTDGSGPSP